MILTWMVFWMRNVSRNVKQQQLEQAVDKALQRGNHHGWALVMMVFSRSPVRGWSRSSFCWRPSSRMSASGRRWGALLGLATAIVLGFLIYWGGIRLNLGVFFKWTSLFILLVAAGLAAGRSAPSTRRACGTCSGYRLRSEQRAVDAYAVRHAAGRIFGYQETPSVSEVAVYLLYLIPALVLFALPPRNNTTASRAA